jgi:hypothetical protein
MYASMRQMRLVSSVAVALAVVVIGGTAFAQSAGTWKLNLEKSKYIQGQAPKSTTLVYEPAGAGIKVTVDQMPAEGSAVHYAYTANYDASQRHHDETGQQDGWKNSQQCDSCRIERWESADHHHHWHGSQGREDR